MRKNHKGIDLLPVKLNYMEFDIKNNLLKASVGENRLSQKNIKATIDDSLVTGMPQKGLDMGLENETAKFAKENEEKEKKKALKKRNSDDENMSKKKAKEIVRDPILLLRLI